MQIKYRAPITRTQRLLGWLVGLAFIAAGLMLDAWMF
jgi:hypothetical protein